MCIAPHNEKCMESGISLYLYISVIRFCGVSTTRFSSMPVSAVLYCSRPVCISSVYISRAMLKPWLSFVFKNVCTHGNNITASSQLLRQNLISGPSSSRELLIGALSRFKTHLADANCVHRFQLWL